MTLHEKYQTVKAARTNFLAALNPRSFDFIIATWFGSGLIIPAPGTWGTLGGMLFGVPLLFLIGPAAVFGIGFALLFLGVFCVGRIEKKLGAHDPSFIVIDEVAAILMMMALLPAKYTALTLLLGFLLFRFFDAKKPWLVGLADRKIKGAWGVMVDDIVAAIFALLTFYPLIILIYFLMGAVGLTV